MAKQSVLTPQDTDFPRWYQDVLAKAELAENGPVRGTMVIRPWGYAIWERIQAEIDTRIKAAGAQNAYFPLFIPESYLTREAEHVEGFSPELAVVTHAGGEKLAEPIVVRPTSETVIGEYMAKWTQSYRDLPLLLNQWANVVRWELRPRLFLRTSEFLWQEGHTAHIDEADAATYARRIHHDVYSNFLTTVLAMPTHLGIKTARERFAGATSTMTCEGMMGDGKALQMGTSHYLGQNFAKSSDVTFLNQAGQREYVFATSWGVSTRLVGALIMTHSDDTGLVLPPKLAPIHVVVVPIFKNDAEKTKVFEEAGKVVTELKAQGLAIKLDDREGIMPGAKYYEWEAKGVPVRIEIGPKDLEKGSLCVVRRFVLEKEGETEQEQRKRKKTFQPRAEAIAGIKLLLDTMQRELLERAHLLRTKRSRVINSLTEFEQFFKDGGGFAWVHWAGTHEQEEEMAKRFETTIRCIPLPDQIPAGAQGAGQCILTGQPSAQRVVMARAY